MNATKIKALHMSLLTEPSCFGDILEAKMKTNSPHGPSPSARSHGWNKGGKGR